MHAWIGLGSNLAGDGDSPRTQLQRAIGALATLPGTRVLAVSPAYRNPALLLPGQDRQPDYVNAVALVDTPLDAHALLDALQAIEAQQGRVRTERWGARTLDLDLLLYDNAQIRTPRLTVPHPGLETRRFVLQPLLDITPALALPDGRRVADLLAACAPSPLDPDGTLALPR